MNTNINVNIDTVEWTLRGMKFDNKSERYSSLANRDGELLNLRQYRVPVLGKFDAHRLHVRTDANNTELLIEGSPYAFLYGQNVFTSSNLARGCIEASRQVSKALQLQPSKELVEHWKTGDIDLRRVDIAANIQMESEEEVLETLAQIRRQLTEYPTTVETNGHSVCWKPHSGSSWSMVFYAKAPQLRHSARARKFAYADRLEHACAGILRAELRLRRDALIDNLVAKVENWTEGTAERLFEEYISLLPLLNVMSGPLGEKELARYPNKLRPVAAAHAAGLDLRSIFTRRTLRRHKNDFQELGIDLNVPRQQEIVRIPLLNLISAQQSATPFDWLRKKGLCPED